MSHKAETVQAAGHTRHPGPRSAPPLETAALDHQTRGPSLPPLPTREAPTECPAPMLLQVGDTESPGLSGVAGGRVRRWLRREGERRREGWKEAEVVAAPRAEVRAALHDSFVRSTTLRPALPYPYTPSLPSRHSSTGSYRPLLPPFCRSLMVSIPRVLPSLQRTPVSALSTVQKPHHGQREKEGRSKTHEEDSTVLPCAVEEEEPHGGTCNQVALVSTGWAGGTGGRADQGSWR